MEATQPNINLKDTQPVKCENCTKEIFTEGVMLRKASRFVTGTPKDAIIPIPVFSCAACGHVNSEFLPKQLQNEGS
jgi:uncharacterized Zn finger protein